MNMICVGGKRSAYRVLVAKPEGKRPLERPDRGWEDNIKMEIKWACGMDSINLPSGALLRIRQ